MKRGNSTFLANNINSNIRNSKKFWKSLEICLQVKENKERDMPNDLIDPDAINNYI